MILTRAPLRISLAGGGTDLPAYRNEVGGLCITAAIDRYVYFAQHTRQPPFEARTTGSYWSDVPWGTGLGSSGAKHAAMAVVTTGWNLATAAKDVWQAEVNEDPYAGFQDPFASVYGGVQRLEWQAESESVRAARFDTQAQASQKFVANLRLLYVGQRGQVSGASLLRSACSDPPSCMARMRRVRELAVDTCALLSNPSGDDVVSAYGAILNEQFALKQSMNPASTPPHIVSIRDELMKAGATGCKLVGAGGSGFLLVAAYDWEPIYREAEQIGLLHMPFNIDEQGAQIVS